MLLLWRGLQAGAGPNVDAGFGGEERELGGGETGGNFVLNFDAVLDFVLDAVLGNSALA